MSSKAPNATTAYENHGGEESNTNKELTYVQRLYPLGFRRQACSLIKSSVSLAISYILSSWLIEFVSLIFMSRLGQAEFNACTLANTIYLLITYSLLLGFNYGCDTLLPQYFGGRRKQMGVVLQRACVISVYPCLISSIIMLNARYLLKWIQPDEHIVRLVDTFLKSYLLVIPFTSLSLSFRVYIGATGRTVPIIGANIIGNVVNIIAHYICLYQFHMGIYSAPLSMTMAYASIMLCYMFYIRFSSLYEETWHPVTRHCLQEWKLHLKYAIPGVFIMLTEFWSVETSTLFAIRLGSRSLSAQSVAQQTVAVVYLVVLAVGDAANILIGENIGANKSKEARNAKNVIYTVTGGFVVFDGIVILVFHRWLPYLFNVQGSALPLAQNVLLIIPLVNIFDGYHVVQNGIAKACGMQKWTSVIFIIGFGAVGLPVAFVTTFVFDLGVFGFWMGMISAEMLTSTLLFILLYRFDWDAYTQTVVSRIASESLPTSNNQNLDECRHLLAAKSTDEKSTDLSMESMNIMETRQREIDSARATSARSLSKSIALKLIVLFPLLCLFLVSALSSYR